MVGTIDAPPRIESLRKALRGDEAALHEVVQAIRAEPESFVAELTEASNRERIQTIGSAARSASEPRLTQEESDLFEQINRGLPPKVWERVRELEVRFRAETLTPSEHEELMALSDQIEIAHAERLGYVLDLAQLRGKTLDEMLDELGIKSPGVA